MMKFLIASAAAVMAAGVVCAQTSGPFGVRAGLNVTNIVNKIDSKKHSSDNRVGYHLGVTYRWDIPAKLPFALETGLMLTSKGGKYKESDPYGSYEETYKLLYLELPLTASYRFDFGKEVSLKPFFGFYYDLGLSGKCKADEDGETETYNIFKGDDQELKRSDFGLRFGAEVGWRYCSLGLAYETSMMNLAKHAANGKIRSHCFMISLGYNF